MSRTKTTSPNASVTGPTHTKVDKLDPVPKPRFRPDITEAEKRHPPIASEFFGPRMFDHELPSQLVGAADEAVFQEPVLDLDPLGRTIIMLPPRPRGHSSARRQTPAMIRPEAYREPGMPDLDELSRQASAMEVGASGGGNEPEGSCSDIESAPAQGSNWSERFIGLFVSAWSFWRRERDIRRSIVALSEMDDRTLRDIGIEHRLLIPEIVRHGPGRK